MLISESQENAMGKNAAPHMEKQFGGVFPDKEINSYVSEVGWKLANIAKQMHRKNVNYSFKVLNSNIPNAFALPGGYIYITAGLLSKLQNEAQLAGVLGHEVGHVNYRHSASRISQAYALQIIIQGGLIIGGVKGVDKDALVASALITSFLGQLLMMGHSREHERESDSIGTEYMVRAGYNPWGIVQVMEILHQQEKLHGGEKVPSIFRTHPHSKERAEILTTLISTRYKDTNNLSLYSERFLHKTKNFKATTEAYQLAYAAQHSLENKNYEEAHRLINAALGQEKENYYFHLIKGEIHFAQKDFKSAYTSFIVAYQLNPSDLETRFQTGKTLVHMEKYRESIQYLKLAEDIAPANEEIHYYLSIAYDKTQRPQLARHHMKLYKELKENTTS